MKIIKCHMCKLDFKECEYACIKTEDVTSLYKENVTEKDAFPKGYCTNHVCEHNPSGFHCILDSCAYGYGNQKI